MAVKKVSRRFVLGGIGSTLGLVATGCSFSENAPNSATSNSSDTSRTTTTNTVEPSTSSNSITTTTSLDEDLANSLVADFVAFEKLYNALVEQRAGDAELLEIADDLASDLLVVDNYEFEGREKTFLWVNAQLLTSCDPALDGDAWLGLSFDGVESLQEFYGDTPNGNDAFYASVEPVTADLNRPPPVYVLSATLEFNLFVTTALTIFTEVESNFQQTNLNCDRRDEARPLTLS